MSTEPLENLEELARRAVACSLFRWTCHMKVVHPAEHAGSTGFTFRLTSGGYVPRPGEYPDLSDDETLLYLEGLIEVHTSMMLNRYEPLPAVWRMSDLRPPNIPIEGASRAEVIVLALERAHQLIEEETSKGKRSGTWLTVRVPDALAARLKQAVAWLPSEKAPPGGYTKSAVQRAVLMAGLDALERKSKVKP